MPAALDPVALSSMAALGLFGSGHCIGMCGPLVLAFPGKVGGLHVHLSYHVARVLTYTLIGALLAALGAAITDLATLVRLQLALSVLAALFLLLFGLSRIGIVPEPRFLSTPSATLTKGFAGASRFAERHPALGMLPLGLMNGLLPCGLSYAALVRAIPSGSAAQGALLVAVFGLGTIPGLLLFGTVASGFARRHRQLMDLVAGMVMIGMAVSLAADVLQQGL